VPGENWTESLPCLATLCESSLVKKSQTNAKLLFLDKLPKAEDCEVQNIITHIFFIIITPLWETAGIQKKSGGDTE